jgi:hypothetical protein
MNKNMENINTTNSNIYVKYEYKKENPVLNWISKLFGELNYNEMKMNETDIGCQNIETENVVTNNDKFEYKYEKLEVSGNNIDEWNVRGKEGWEMIQRETDNRNSISYIIWKRKIK